MQNRRPTGLMWVAATIILAAGLIGCQTHTPSTRPAAVTQFNSNLQFNVFVWEYPDGQRHFIGLTPSPKPLKIPSGFAWGVIPICKTSVTDMAQEMRNQPIPGTALMMPDGSAEDLANLKDLNGLQTLDLTHSAATDAGLENLKDLHGLHTLILSAMVTDAGLEKLKGLKELRTLSIGYMSIANLEEYYATNSLELYWVDPDSNAWGVTDAGLRNLKDLKQLQWLDLGTTAVSDAGLQYLTELKALRVLALTQTGITDAGLEHLKDMTQLRRLFLGDTAITDAGLAHLQNLSQLQELDLWNTKVSDEGLQYLKNLKNLRKLNLRDTQVTIWGKIGLNIALPHCAIYFY